MLRELVEQVKITKKYGWKVKLSKIHMLPCYDEKPRCNPQAPNPCNRGGRFLCMAWRQDHEISSLNSASLPTSTIRHPRRAPAQLIMAGHHNHRELNCFS